MQKSGDRSGILLTGGCASAANARESDRVAVDVVPCRETMDISRVKSVSE
ncbi:hypothetical protein [Scytonema millei]|uniref:Uncharacterized protein n=1 Tax=Scytonema millei VB511283 TaxID=1245923 RepID=A0A9X5E633_9CYAN|nr:hypothetical protein [Scytonema millei]NHC35951.1 hypothetical protein [Scytonema millei VB511283]